jgi:hypothetical protein
MRCVLAKRAGAFGDRLLHTLDDIKGVDDFETVGYLHKASEDIICDKVNNVKKKSNNRTEDIGEPSSSTMRHTKLFIFFERPR